MHQRPSPRQRALRTLAAAAMLLAVTPGLRAADLGFTGEIGPAAYSGKHVGTAADFIPVSFAFGYRITPAFGVRAVYLQPGYDIYFGPGKDTLQYFLGGELTAAVPISGPLALNLGAGAGSTKLNGGPGGHSRSTSEPVVAAGLAWKFNAHFAMELREEYLTHTATSVTSLMFQVPF